MPRNWTNAASMCDNQVNYISDLSNVNKYDIRNFGEDLDRTDNALLSLFDDSAKRNDIYTALHVENSYKNPKYTHQSINVRNAYIPDKLIDYTGLLDQMIADGYKVILYGGEWDAVTNTSNIDFLKYLKNLDSSFCN